MQTELLCQALAAGAEGVKQLVAGVTPEEARHRPQPASWSMLEVVCHMYDEEREDFRYRLDVMLHRPGEAWPPNDPQGWVVARRYNEQNMAERLEAFLAERRQSLAWLSGLKAPNWDATYPAPWGPMRAGDMLAAWVTHDNLSLRQLVELRYAWLGRVVAPYQVGYAGDW